MRSSHAVVIFVCIGLLATQSTAQQPAHGEQARLVKQIRGLEDELARAVVSRDYASLRRIEADSYVYTDADANVNTRDQFIEAYRSGNSRITMLRFDEITVQIYSDTAVVRGVLTVDRSDNGVHLSRRSRYTRVYVHFPEGWRAVVGHSSELRQETSLNSR